MPSEIASCPLAESTSRWGRRWGDPRPGPPPRTPSLCPMTPITPPIAEPKTIPTRAGSKPSRRASSTASRAARSASKTLRSSFRTSRGDATSLGSKSFTSAAIRTGKPLASKERMKSIPLSPASAARQVDGTSFPIGVTAPRPVTTARLIRPPMLWNAGLREPLSRLSGPGPSPLVLEGDAYGSGRFSQDRGRRQATLGLLPLLALRPVPARRRVPGPGAPAPPEPWHVPALQRRAGGAARSRQAVRGRRDADPHRRRGAARAGTSRTAPRLPRHRGVPRALAELEPLRQLIWFGRSFQTDARAKPARPDDGTASRASGDPLDRDALLLQRELGEAIPVALDRRGHLLLVLEDVARGRRGLLVAGPLGDPREELVARDLEVLRRVAVARVAAGFLGTRKVDDALHQRAEDPARLPDDRRRGAARAEALLHLGRVLLGLELVILQRLLDFRVFRRRDHPIQHPEHVLLQRVGLVDVLDELRLQFVCHCSPPHREVAVDDAVEGRAAAVAVGALRFDDVDEARERRLVVELVAANLEGNPGQGPDDGRSTGAVDALPHAEERRQRATRPLDLPDPVQTGHDG